MKENIAFVLVDGSYLRLEYWHYKHGDAFTHEKKIDPNKLSNASRKRLQAFVAVNNWLMDSHESWSESGFGYDFTEYNDFVLLDKDQEGDPNAKIWLLYLLMNDDEREAYEVACNRARLKEQRELNAYFCTAKHKVIAEYVLGQPRFEPDDKAEVIIAKTRGQARAIFAKAIGEDFTYPMSITKARYDFDDDFIMYHLKPGVLDGYWMDANNCIFKMAKSA